jgi:multidrug efflux pump subunit AcrA (membrane-fusion protein)
MTLIFIVAALFWAGLSIKTYVVKANGLIASENKTNIMNRVSGSIDKINVREGDSVKKGDVLIEIDGFQLELQIAQIKANVDFYSVKVDIMKRLIEFINNFVLDDEATRINPFDKNNPAEMKAYSDAQTLIDYIKNQEEAAEREEPAREYTQAEADGLKTQFASQQYATLDEYTAQLIQQQSQLTMYQDGLSEYKIIAEQDGSVHLSAGLTVGTVLQAGSLIGNISSSDNTALYLETIVGASDRAKIVVGDTAEIALSGVMQSEYGVLNGKIMDIDSDSTQTEDGAVIYRVTIKPERTLLKDKKGNVINLSIGMLAECRIKYDETTWLKWAVEQIGIKLR